MGRAVCPPAVPPTIVHLLLEQVVSNGVETVVVMLEVGEDGEHHSGDAGLAAASPAVVDAAVSLDPLVEEGRASSPRLPVFGWQTEIA
ncbi:hypothetical protein IIA15_02295 [candidate division TA06 bacterium]|nr:hypothetical protein [candidate division TA06 bacterium]